MLTINTLLLRKAAGIPNLRLGTRKKLVTKLNVFIIDTQTINRHEKHIQLHRADTLPNKDFVLRYEVA
ncbi:MAG: hypothetical protein ABFS56_30530, partial [Pseudomonadota bacterium]